MAFSRNGLCRIGGSGEGGSIWMYSSVDSIANTQIASYFDDAATELNKGDAIFITRDDGIAHLHITYVRSITAGVVLVAAGTTITHT